MAEIDTGLGWAAKDTWLVRNANITIASIRSTVGAVKLPVATNNAELLDHGLLAAKWYSSSAQTDRYVYVGTREGDDVVAFCSEGFSGNIVCFGGTTNQSMVYTCIYEPATGNIWLSGSAVTDGSPINNLYRTDTSYITGISTMQPMSGVPYYPTPTEGYNSVSFVNADFTKTAAGYSVACLAKWKTPNGTPIMSPILISSVTEYTDMDQPAETSYNLAKLNILRNGIRYYMSFFDITDNPAITTVLPVFDMSGPDDPKLTLAMLFANIAMLDNAAILELNPPDPYGEEGGGSGEEGGDGDTDPEDDPVTEETLPVPSVAGLGFSTIYVPTAADLYSLASYLWGGNLDLDTFLKLFSNPMDSILGLSAVPVQLSGTYEPIYLGGQLLQGVTMPRYTGRTAIKVDMGTTTISERWGSYLDYDPYTELSVYLPFIGIKNVKADDLMGKTVSLMYNIDILSGACVAYLRPAGGSPLYEWAGQCAMQIPITGANWDNIFSTAISTAVTLGGAMVAPASAPMLSGSVASAAVQAVAAKPRIERSGAVTGVTGFLGQLRPYIIRTIPEAYIPNEQNKYIGYPSYISANLGSVAGYNEIASIHLENIPATGDELTELESILKGGVIF